MTTLPDEKKKKKNLSAFFFPCLTGCVKTCFPRVDRLMPESNATCTCFHLPWQRLDVLALCVSVFQPLSQRKHYYSIFELPFVDTSVKIESGGAAWNRLKCSADSRLLYLDEAQSKKGPGDILAAPYRASKSSFTVHTSIQYLCAPQTFTLI